MNISKFKMGLTAFLGFVNPLNLLHPLESAVTNVVGYLVDVANAALAAIDPDKRATIAAAYNTFLKVAVTLRTLAWRLPTRWQSAYRNTIGAVEAVANALMDFTIEPAELTNVKDAFNAAVIAWRGGDVPDTDVDFSTIKED
jgi:hypothetical protein